MAGGFTIPTDGPVGELVRELRDMRRRIDELERPTGTQNATIVRQTAEIVAALPVPAGYFADDTGFGLNTGIKNIGVTVTVPEGKTRVVLTAVANVAVLDATSGGLAVATAFIEANGPGFIWSSPVVPASKDAGASAVNNIITPVLGFEQDDLTPGSTFLLNMSIDATNPSAYTADPFNFGTLAVTAIFFN